jgi:hypothetical protein
LSDVARLLALNVGCAASGAAVAIVAGLPVRRAWLPTIAGLALALGIATWGLAANLGAMTGIDVRLLSTALVVVAAILVATAVRRVRPPTLGSLSPPPAGALARATEAACLAALAVLSIAVLRLSSASVLDQWDGWAIWAPKAHALFVDGDAWGPVFREQAYAMQHSEYPLFLPALEALSAHAIGRFDPTLIDTEAAVVLVAFGWAAWAMLRLVVVPVVAAAVAVALVSSAPLIVNATANYADSVLAAYTALGLLGLLLWLTEGSATLLALAAIFMAAAASTKPEGVLFAVSAVAAALAVAHGFGRSVRTAAAFASGVLAVPVVWMLVNRLNGHGARNVEVMAFVDPGRASDAVHRVPIAAVRLLDEIVTGWPVATLAVALALAVACLSRLWWHALFVGLWGVLALLALVAVYYSSPYPIDWYLATSADRVVFSIVLALATVTPLLVMTAWRRATEGADERPPWR